MAARNGKRAERAAVSDVCSFEELSSEYFCLPGLSEATPSVKKQLQEVSWAAESIIR